MPDRLTLSALADRLIYGDDRTFSADDARALWQALSGSPKVSIFAGFFRFRVQGTTPGFSRVGYSPGVGHTSLRDQQKFDYDNRGRAVVRAGQWKLHRERRSVEIEQVMADDSDEGRIARIEYRR